MTPTERKVLLIRKGIKQVDIARECNVTPGMVHGLIVGRFKSKRLKAQIAHLLNTDFNVFWGKQRKCREL